MDSDNHRTKESLQGYHDIISILMLTTAPSGSADLERLEEAERTPATGRDGLGFGATSRHAK